MGYRPWGLFVLYFIFYIFCVEFGVTLGCLFLRSAHPSINQTNFFSTIITISHITQTTPINKKALRFSFRNNASYFFLPATYFFIDLYNCLVYNISKERI